MKLLADQLQDIINEKAFLIENIEEEEFRHRPSPDKWSKKEILGHLVDSAQNNIQRFVRGRYETGIHIVYDQNNWVEASDYLHYPTSDLIHLWILLNQHLCILWRNMPEAAYSNMSNLSNSEPVWLDLRAVAQDYIAHLEHHIGQLKLEE